MGCATGEEAWTLAMLLTTHASRAGGPPADQIRIIGSDVDAQALVTADAGKYAAQAVEAIREVLPSYRPVPGGAFTVDASLRPRVTFRREDLTTLALTPGPCDLVCCRNLLIFLGPEGQRRVLDAAFRSLPPGGLLMLGRTESLMALSEPRLVPVDITHRIYRRVS
jgi:chemotaxis methyl-accepting protein methylase